MCSAWSLKQVAAGALTSDRKLGATLPEFGSAVSGSGCAFGAQVGMLLYIILGRSACINGLRVQYMTLYSVCPFCCCMYCWHAWECV